ncbi:hypothetical protein G6M26_27380 [Agrobacterium tumefaciens]|nr:hypothetical protein [Agrobacterium tumefaciens]
MVDSIGDGKTSITKKVVLPDVISADSVIEITRELKQKDDNPENFVCFFYQPGMDLSICWVAVSYLADSLNCNKKDRNGACVKYEEVRPDFASLETLMRLKSKKLNRKDLVKEIVDMTAYVKYEVFKKDNGSQAVFVTLWPDGREKVIPLKVKNENGVKKYLFDSPNIPGVFVLEEKYMVIYDSEDMKSSRSLPYQ